MSGNMDFGWIIGIAVLIVLLWFLTWYVRPNQSSQTKIKQSPPDIQNDRYAKGEIEKDEYLEKKKHLE